ncbi:MAG: glycoside hydrolase family 2 protein [Christensenellaceae bacterium]
MIRTFQTHEVRPQRELTGTLWQFTPLQGERAGETLLVHTPSCRETYPGLELYRGEGSYTTQFTGAGNLRIECKGVSHTATVFLDGKKIAKHYNAYTAFSAVVQKVPAGTHELTIVADNRFSEESALHVPNDYMSYGGVSRPVVVEQLDNAYIDSLHVTPSLLDGKRHARIRACVISLGETSPVPLCVRIASQKLSFDARILPEGESIFEGDLAMEDVRIRSPETPNLYTATATLIRKGVPFDDLIDRFGFREVRIEGKRILLNGKPLKIKGVCRHEDHPQYGCALPFAAMAYDLALIRALNANSVRTAHYPNDEAFLDLCDEPGILVWEENHARGLSVEQMQNPHFEPQSEQVAREMVTQHYNHPCIYIRGILNECASDSEFGRECYRKQFALIRSFDESRPYSFASCKFKTDLCFDLPNVVSYNIYPQWFHDTPAREYLADLYAWVQTRPKAQASPFSSPRSAQRAVRPAQSVCRQMERGISSASPATTARGGTRL